MARKRKKKIARLIHQSTGPLPLRHAGRFAGHLLVFSDASRQKQGGMAAVMFNDEHPATLPLVSRCSVAPGGSNELELQAALFALHQAKQYFPGRPVALFSDNQDAVSRLNRARERGLAQDPALAQMLLALAIGDALSTASIRWIKGHGNCRGNTLADRHAAAAANATVDLAEQPYSKQGPGAK